MAEGISGVIGAMIIAAVSLSALGVIYFLLGGFSNSINTTLTFSAVSCSPSEISIYMENIGTIPAFNIIVKKDNGESCSIPIINAGGYGSCKVQTGGDGVHLLTATESGKNISAEVNCTAGNATILTTTTTSSSIVQQKPQTTMTQTTTRTTAQTTTQTATQTTTQTTSAVQSTTTQIQSQTLTTTSALSTTTTIADTTPPTTSITCNSAACVTNWYNSDITISLSCSDTGSGCNIYNSPGYCFDQSNSCVANKFYVGTFIISTEGTNYVKYNSSDNTGNIEATKVQTLHLDKTPPTSTILCNGAACSTNYYSSAVTVSLGCSDSLSGCASNPLYCVDQSNSCTPTTPYSVSFAVSSQGSNFVRFSSADLAGNMEQINSQIISIGSQPWGFIQITPASPTSQNSVNYTAWQTTSSPTLYSIKIYVNSQQKRNCFAQPISPCTYWGGPYDSGTTRYYYAVFTDQNFNTYQTPTQQFTVQ